MKNKREPLKLKKKLCSLFALMFMCAVLIQQPVLSEETDEVSVEDRIAAIGFGKVFSSDPQREILGIFKKLDSYTEKQDLKKIKQLYSDDFVNNDGYDLETYIKSVKNGFSSYTIKTLFTKVNNIAINDDYAIVHVTETGEAETLKPVDGIDGNGLIISTADVYYYLKKQNGKWKIASANIMDETCSILYGVAKSVYFSINVPTQVKSGSEYTISLSFAPLKEVFVAASLFSSPIIYPMNLPKTDFKAIKGDGVLERLVTSNSDNYNEYAIATIGLSSPKIIGTNQYDIETTGSAIVMRRVNVFKPMPQKIVKKANNKKTEAISETDTKVGQE